MKRIRKTAMRAAAVAALMLALPQVHAIGLLEAYRAALKNDPSFRMAIDERRAGAEYKAIGRAGLLPNLQGNYSASNNRTDITDVLGTRHPVYVSRSASVSVRQALLNFEAIARYKQGVAQSAYAEAQFDGQKREFALRVAGAYFDALFADEQLRLAQAQRDTYAEQRSLNQRLFKGGEGTKTDMLETQARLDIAEAQLLEARDNQATARGTLAGLIGEPVTQLDSLPESFKMQAADMGDYATWEKLALDTNADLLASKHAIEAARQEINKNRAGHLPRIDLVGSYSKSSSETLTTLGQDITSRAIGVQIVVPLYSGGYYSAATRQAAANYDRARDEYDVRKSRLLVDLQKQYNAVKSSMVKIAATEIAVASSTELVKATGESIRGGVRINLDLLNAQQQLYAARRELSLARYNYLLATLRLHGDAGVLGERDIEEVSALFRVKS
jgi:protease secretion system outer membrane protein